MENLSHHILTFTEADAGQRLDKALANHLPDLSRSRIQALLKEQHICFYPNGTIATASCRVKPDDQLSLTIPVATPSVLTPNPIALDIIYEDDDLIVLNKPAFMTVHPGIGTKEDTLVHALLAHCKGSLSGIGGVERPGIVHRLDRDTSGLMIVAKNDMTHHHLAAQLANRTLSRRYLAFVYGILTPTSGTFSRHIDRSHINRRKMACYQSRGRIAITHYRTKETFCNDAVSLVECRLETGRTHQIRVHMTHLGHGLLADPLYGSPHRASLNRLTEEAREIIQTLHRQALHATSISFIHPKDEKSYSFEIPLPEDLRHLYETLTHS